MVDGMKSGGAVKASRTFMEEPARMAFESGKATFMRNWSYAYALAKKAPKVKDGVEVSPLPPFEGGGEGGVLGGNGPGRERVHRQPRGLDAVARLLDLGGDAQARRGGVLAAADDAAALRRRGRRRRRCPYAKELRTAVENATSRPVSPVYSQISQAVFTNVNKAIGGQMSPEDALKKGQEQIEKALSSF